MDLDFLKGSTDDQADENEINELVELDATTKNQDGDKISIEVETIAEFDDVEEVQEKIRQGSIVWVNISKIKSGDMGELKRAVNRLKKTVSSVEGDMAGVDEDYIVVCPQEAEIER